MPSIPFRAIEFPTDLAYGLTKRSRSRVIITGTVSGFERRNSLWSQPLRAWDGSTGISRIKKLRGEAAARDALADLKAFHYVMDGPTTAFLMMDPDDYTSAPDGLSEPLPDDALLGIGDGTTTTFQLRRPTTYEGNTRLRPIRFPRVGSVRVMVGGVERTSGFTVNAETGALTFASAPASGAEVRAGFEFLVPARFREEHLSSELTDYLQGQAEVTLDEVRL